MKSYDMTQPTASSTETSAEKHKKERDKILCKTSKPMEKEEDEFEDNNLDDIDEDTDSDYDTNNDNSNDDSDENIEESDDDNDDDVIRDSSGAEAKIQNPMWQSNEKRNEKLEKQKSKGKYSSDEDFYTILAETTFSNVNKRLAAHSYYLSHTGCEHHYDIHMGFLLRQRC
jgi:hypothetical protein